MKKTDKKNHIKKVNELTEERQNSERSIVSELFGFSKSEKEAKERSMNVKLAIDEINRYDFNEIATPKNKTNSLFEIRKIIGFVLDDARTKLPILAKLLPEMFNNDETKAAIIYKNIDGHLEECITPASWHALLRKQTPETLNDEAVNVIDSNDEIKTRFIIFINKKFA